MLEEIKQKLQQAFGKYEFVSDGHYYLYDGERVGISATTFLHEFSIPFDSKKIAPISAKKAGVSVEEILRQWKYKADFACDKGTSGHEYVQSLFTKTPWEKLPFDNSKEYNDAIDKIKLLANKYYDEYKDRYIHIKDELLVGSEEFDIASAVDHLFYDKVDKCLVIVDYKTNSVLKGYDDDSENAWYTKSMLVPLQDLKDTAFNTYKLQMSLYKYLIEKYTKLKIDRLELVHITELKDNYEIIQIPYLKNEIEKILELRRVKNMNSVGVLLMGASGTGKSTSFRNLPPEETAIINITNKPMPFRNTGIKVATTTNYETIIKAIETSKKRIIVIDDSSYLMSFENFEKANNKGYDKFTQMAVNYYKLIEAVRNADGEKIVYLVMHEENDDVTGLARPKTIGKMLNQQLVIEGLFSIVLRSLFKNNDYIFQTQNDGTSVCKSPMEMFTEKEIPNDLAEVDKAIREYYGFTPIDKPLKQKKEEEK